MENVSRVLKAPKHGRSHYIGRNLKKKLEIHSYGAINSTGPYGILFARKIFTQKKLKSWLEISVETFFARKLTIYYHNQWQEPPHSTVEILKVFFVELSNEDRRNIRELKLSILT